MLMYSHYYILQLALSFTALVVDISLSIKFNDENEVQIDEESSTTIMIDVTPSISADGDLIGSLNVISVEISFVNSSAGTYVMLYIATSISRMMTSIFLEFESDYRLAENFTTSINFDTLAPATIEIETIPDDVLEGDEVIVVSVVPVLDETMPFIIRQMGDPVTITITDANDGKSDFCV